MSEDLSKQDHKDPIANESPAVKVNFARLTGKKAVQLLESMEDLADRAGIEVRYDALKSGPVRATSGNCEFNGKPLIVIDRSMQGQARAFALARELAAFDLEGVFLQPAVRDFIDFVKDVGGDA
jgi:hypothetical protein